MIELKSTLRVLIFCFSIMLAMLLVLLIDRYLFGFINLPVYEFKLSLAAIVSTLVLIVLTYFKFKMYEKDIY